MASRKKNKGGGLIVGPVLIVAAMSALWKNETRFDYHKAALKTGHASILAEMESGRNASYTGEMDQSLELSGTYIATFTGYLTVDRSAQIYCWERDEDDDGDVTWSKRWMTSVESNSRNSGIRQELKSGSLLPPAFQLGELPISSRKIEFVDPRVSVPPGPLPKTKEGERLAVDGDYLLLRKGQPDRLGDERISYRAIPVPATATWFGRFEGGEGTADLREQRSGFINSIIRNTGVLHHLVAGERDEALETMKKHLQKLKWIVRGIGTALVVFGMIFLFSSVVRFLYNIPLIGRVAEAGAILLAVAIGVPLALLTIALGFVAGNPLLLIPIIAIVLAAIWLLTRLSRRQREKGEAVKQQLDSEFGHALGSGEMKQLEYREMASLLASGGSGIGAAGEKALDRFARKSGIEKEERATLLEEVRETPAVGESAEIHLRNLIRLAVADARLTPQEVRSIREAAGLAGYDRQQFRQLMSEVGEMADARKAT